MAFGFTPKYTEDLYLENFTPQQFLVLAIVTANKIGWLFDFKSETGFIARTSNAKLISWNSKITLKIGEEKAIIKSESTGKEMADLGRNKRAVRKFTDTLIDFKYSLKPEELDQKYEELKPSLVPKEQDVLSQPTPTATENISGFFSIFKPKEGYFITPILVDLNIFIFILMVLSGVSIMLPDNESLIKWGANFRPITLEGGWWRLITNCFLHIGVFHLLMNMYALLYIGLLLEPRLGKIRFISAYLLTGIIASVASLWWHDLTISAGASGAIFGMYGVFLAMLTTNLIEKTARKALLTSIGIFVAYNLMYGMKGGIDNAAHVGGLIGGLIIGYAYYPSLKKSEEPSLRYSTIGILSVLIIAASFVVYKKVPNDIVKYDEVMNKFATNETMALKIYQMPKNTAKENLLSEIKDKGLYYWNENIKLINGLERLNIPEILHDRNNKILQYCDLRIKSYNLIYKTINEDTNIYTDSIKHYNVQIKAIMDSLKEK